MKKAEVKKIIEFIDDYNAIGYGEAKVIETKKSFVIWLYNAGFSENEDLERKFLKKLGHKYLLYDNHPLIFLGFNKLFSEMEDKTVFDDFRKLECYEKREIPFEYRMVIE